MIQLDDKEIVNRVIPTYPKVLTEVKIRSFKEGKEWTVSHTTRLRVFKNDKWCSVGLKQDWRYDKEPNFSETVNLLERFNAFVYTVLIAKRIPHTRIRDIEAKEILFETDSDQRDEDARLSATYWDQ